MGAMPVRALAKVLRDLLNQDWWRQVTAGLAIAAVVALFGLVVLQVRSGPEPGGGGNASPDAGSSGASQIPGGFSASAHPTSTASPSVRPEVPTPPPPFVTASAGADTPEVVGRLVAQNMTLKQTSATDWIEAAPDDEILATLTITNRGGSALSGLLLRAHVFVPPDNPELRLLYFGVQEGEGGPETNIPGASLVLEWPKEEGCGFAKRADAYPWTGDEAASVGDLVVTTAFGDRAVPQRSAASWVQEHVVAQYNLPEIAAGASAKFRGPIYITPPDQAGVPAIDGGALKFRTEDGAEYHQTGGARVGDVVTLLVTLHNGDCSMRDAQAVLRATVGKFRRARGYLTISAMTKGDRWMLHPRTTRMTRATINIEGGEPATLQPMRGTTRLHGGTCSGTKEIELLPDYLFQSGVGISVPGYIPRMECETHIRFVTTDLLVVKD